MRIKQLSNSEGTTNSYRLTMNQPLFQQIYCQQICWKYHLQAAIRLKTINMQNEPKSMTYAEPKAKSEPVPTRRERAGEPNFKHTMNNELRTMNQFMQNEPNFQKHQESCDENMQNEPNFNPTSSWPTSPHDSAKFIEVGPRVTRDESRLNMQNEPNLQKATISTCATWTYVNFHPATSFTLHAYLVPLTAINP
jgi:hypothetical protein